jgi:hypothetical protein
MGYIRIGPRKALNPRSKPYLTPWVNRVGSLQGGAQLTLGYSTFGVEQHPWIPRRKPNQVFDAGPRLPPSDKMSDLFDML